jgi:hypothetical protein
MDLPPEPDGEQVSTWERLQIIVCSYVDILAVSAVIGVVFLLFTLFILAFGDLATDARLISYINLVLLVGFLSVTGAIIQHCRSL